MFSASTALLAFFVGIVGCIFGGTQTFIVTGFVGLFIYALQAVGIQSEFLTETLMNTVFLPAIIFNAASVSTAYAAKHYDIEGWDINHSLLFTHDPIVSILAGLGGVAGYLVFAFARGIPVGFPVCLAEPKRLIFRQATPQTRFVCGKFGIPVPPEGAPQLVPDEQTVCLLPALGYDRGLNRLGYGGGYYDRFLQTFPGLAVGVCRENAFCPTVFPEPHDLPVDLLITEKSTLTGQDPRGRIPARKN